MTWTPSASSLGRYAAGPLVSSVRDSNDQILGGTFQADEQFSIGPIDNREPPGKIRRGEMSSYKCYWDEEALQL